MHHSADAPDYDPADYCYGLGTDEVPPGHYTKGPDGKSQADRMREFLGPAADVEQIAF